MENIDYKALCWKLADKLNEIWRNKTGNKGHRYSFEFNRADAYYMYSSGLVAQISVLSPISGLVPVVRSKLGGLFSKGCETSEEAFKSMIENYLSNIKSGTWYDFELDISELPKTIKEINA